MSKMNFTETPIRTIAAASLVLVVSAAPLTAAVTETHLNEITDPIAVYTTARVAVLDALPAPTAAEKKERKLLRGLAKTLSKTAIALKQDFAELVAAGGAQDKLGLAALPMQTASDEAIRRAQLSLSERVELARDYLALLTNAKHRAAVQKAIDSVATARNAAAIATKAGKRAAALAKASKAVTTALKTGDKFVLSDVGGGAIPPTRWRSGDSISSGRVAVPRDSGSPIAGASIVIPAGHLVAPTVITLEAAPSFVSGKDLAAGPAVAVGPDGLAVGAGVTLYAPYALPADTSAADLALFAVGPPVTQDYSVNPRSDGTLAASIQTLSTFQPGIAAPPPGQPAGTYHVMTLLLSTTTDPAGDGGETGQVFAATGGGVLDQTITFRHDHTASVSSSGLPFLSRTFTQTGAAHHTDFSASNFAGSSDFTWTADGDGRFSFSLRISTVVSVEMSGVASADGRVISWSGRGGTLELLGVGVKTDANTVTAQLAGRWAAVETGLELRDPDAEPFTTRRHAAFRAFSVDGAGAVTFETTGRRFETDTTYHSADADPVHTRTENVITDGGAETWTIGIGGRLTGAAALRSGWFDPASGLIVSTTLDGTNRRASLMVAVPQPASGDPSVIPGLYHWAGLDVGATAGTPSAESSTHDVTPTAGSLDVASVSSATLATDASSRVAYTLETVTQPSFLWKLSSATTALPATSVGVPLALDAAGSHTELADEFWYAFSGDGRCVLRMTRGEATFLARGIAIGVR